ncbi:MoaA/NifB/PqqE/SkfB family radical SAM enzyme [Desulfobaculum xiamenense]|uniref:MoaA/NifB/PqqE/SkfB family radical SAM enzyme n=1 Tax=Desulfobaculum xiamenense TaxID=995050 RepID=A0A846QKH4_9BACT|nr:radical SAM protein [Desulfobaculum xiamenense]NJB68698.1 MoaA/NifB/PqqE/SkfB family radical SAM enzyme [Desulfobaculum xiamenense]
MEEKRLGLKKTAALARRYWPTMVRMLPKLYVERFNRRVLLGFPRIITVFATERCNMRCPMCLVWQSREHFGEADETIGLASMRAVIDEAARWGTGFYFTGGEPLMNRELPQVIAHAASRRLVTGMTTNGLLLERRAGELVDAGLTFLSVSVDAREEAHDANRGLKGAYAGVLSGIARVRECMRERNSPFPVIKLNSTFLPQNLDDLDFLVELAGELRVDELTFQHFSFVDDACREAQARYAQRMPFGKLFQGMDVGERCFSPEQVEKIVAFMERAPELGRRHGVRVGFGPTTNDVRAYYEPGFPSRESFCSLPWSEASIRANGDIEMCHGHVIGNIAQGSVREAWMSEPAQAFRAYAGRHPNAPPCYRCCALKYVFPSRRKA